MLFLSFFALLIIMIVPFGNVKVVIGVGEGGERDNEEIFVQPWKLIAKLELKILQGIKTSKICKSEKIDKKKNKESFLLCDTVKSLYKIYDNLGNKLHEVEKVVKERLEKKVEKVGEKSLPPFFGTNGWLSVLLNKLTHYFPKLSNKTQGKELDNKVGEHCKEIYVSFINNGEK
jgi:hypothetical protein